MRRTAAQVLLRAAPRRGPLPVMPRIVPMIARWSPVVSGRTALPILQVDLHQPHAFVVLYGARRYRCTAHR